MATNKKTIKIKPIIIRETCGNCDDFSHINNKDGMCLYNPPFAYLDNYGVLFYTRVEIESDDPCCRHFKPTRSI